MANIVRKIGDWDAYIDPGSGKEYFCNRVTKETAWTEPKLPGGAGAPPQKPVMLQMPGAGGPPPRSVSPGASPNIPSRSLGAPPGGPHSRNPSQNSQNGPPSPMNGSRGPMVPPGGPHSRGPSTGAPGTQMASLSQPVSPKSGGSKGPLQQNMANQNAEVLSVQGWSNDDVCKWLASFGANAAIPAFQQHSVIGMDLPLITEEGLRYMKVPLGPALRIMKNLEEIIRSKREADDRATIERRNRIIAEFDEFYGRCAAITMICEPKKHYKLTGNSFSVLEQTPLICCGGMKNDNIDLSSIKDVDNSEDGLSCRAICCGKMSSIHITSEGGAVNIIRVEAAQGATLAKTIRDTWELSQLQKVARVQ